MSRLASVAFSFWRWHLLIRRYITFLALILLVLVLSGCRSTSRDNTDYLAIHYDFLHYSLGDFEVLSESESRYASEWHVQYSRRWMLQYERHDGEVRTFSLNNALSQNIMLATVRIALQELSDVVYAFFDSAEITITQQDTLRIVTPEASIAINMNDWFLRRISSEDTLDPQNGIRLYSVTTKELITDWGATLHIQASIQADENYLDVIEQLEVLTRALSDYLEADRINLRYFLTNVEADYARDVDFSGFYNRETDTFYLN